MAGSGGFRASTSRRSTAGKACTRRCMNTCERAARSDHAVLRAAALRRTGEHRRAGDVPRDGNGGNALPALRRRVRSAPDGCDAEQAVEILRRVLRQRFEGLAAQRREKLRRLRDEQPARSSCRDAEPARATDNRSRPATGPAGIRARHIANVVAFLNVTMPEIETYQPRSSAHAARAPTTP